MLRDQRLELGELPVLLEAVEAEVPHLEHADRERHLGRELVAPGGPLRIGAARRPVVRVDLVGDVRGVAEEIVVEAQEAAPEERHLERLGHVAAVDRVDLVVDAVAVREHVGALGGGQAVEHAR